MSWVAGGLLLLVYALTLAPGVTFWDAGEFIAAAHVFGIPHPPGTPLYIALGRAWTLLLGDLLGVARTMNFLSAIATASAGALAAHIVARGNVSRDASWGALAGALCAGLMSSVWANATETEVYAVSLMYVMVMLACAMQASDDDGVRGDRWTLCTGYLVALIPAIHLSALVGAPAAIVLASRRRDGGWNFGRALMLSGVVIASAGIGRMSIMLTAVGAAIIMLAALTRLRASQSVLCVALVGCAASALALMLIRARFDPAVNQGNPSTLVSLADVVARRQYDVAPMWPRRAPIWIQLATLGQYADWQAAFAWGRGIFTTPARVVATAIFVVSGISGWRVLRRDAVRVADALGVLLVCGTLGVCAYLNLKAGSSIGYGFVPADAHEARERDYFFVLGFWSWGLFAGYGALAFMRARRWPPGAAAALVLIPLVGNWPALDRARTPNANAAREVAERLLTTSPANAVLFVGGDNDTYPLWYLQQVEGVRRDVQTVTIPMLPADWYAQEIARRTGLTWPASERVAGAKWLHEERAALIARAARRSGRPVAVSPAVSPSNRALLGSGWALAGTVYVSSADANGLADPPTIPPDRTSDHPTPAVNRRTRLPDDVSDMMLAIVDCRRLARIPGGPSALRDSLETRCNLR